MQDQAPLYPQNRSVWNVSDLNPGTFANYDAGRASIGAKVASGQTIKFGTFVKKTTAGELEIIEDGDLVIAGVAMQALNVEDYVNLQYTEGELAELATRGVVAVKIDPANKPSAYGNIFVSFESGKEGWLTSVNTNAMQLDKKEVEIREVGDNVALVYLSGLVGYTATDPTP